MDWSRFVQLDPFPRKWRRNGLSDEDLRALEILIMAVGEDPKLPPPIPGTAGLRKVRFSPAGSNKGKRSTYRICYASLRDHGIVLLVTVYAKNEKDDLTEHDKRAISMVLNRIREQLDKGVIR